MTDRQIYADLGGWRPGVERALVSRAAKKRILKWVIGIHVGLVVIPLLITLFWQWLRPEVPEIIKIKLVPPAPMHQTPKNKPSPVKQPTFNPPPPSTPKIPDRPRPKPPKTKPQPVPKRSHLLRPEDIKFSNEIVKKTKPQPRPARPTPARVNAAQIARNLRNAGKVSVQATPQDSTQQNQQYMDIVQGYIARNWQQPGRVSLGGRQPKVPVRVRIDKSGRIVSYRILRKSGVPAMDNSVESLFKNLSRLPAPPNAMEFEILMVVTD